MMSISSLLEYYQQNCFNPVPISLEDRASWETHFAKRRNLYESHLGIPLSLLGERSVLEFGCNSGENALVLACVGAKLSLVEPNNQVLPQLQLLFQKFGLEKQVIALSQEEIGEFVSNSLYDLVLAEGFLFTLPNRDEMAQKIGNLLKPGGFGIISFNDRYGCFLEMTRRMLLWRAYQIQGIELKDIQSAVALEIGRKFYQEDFVRISASRPFEAWWKDTLINPFLMSKYHWSYSEVLSQVEQVGCEFYSSSPKWTTYEYFNWYKKTSSRDENRQNFQDNYKRVFPFFLTGLSPNAGEWSVANSELINEVAQLVAKLADFDLNSAIESITYPKLLDEYLSSCQDRRLVHFNSEMKKIYESVKANQWEALLSAYSQTKYVRQLWGTPLQYVCFKKLG